MNPNKKFDKNEKPYFNITNKHKDILLGIWANVQAKALHFDKVNFDKYHTALPRQYNNVKLILRCIWTSFDYISGLDRQKQFDHIAVGGVINCRMFGYPEEPCNRNRWKMRKIQSMED